MQNVIRDVHNGTSFVSAANPRTTLMRIFKAVQVNDQIRQPMFGRKFMLTRKQQTEICARIYRLAAVGMAIIGRLLRRSIFTYAEKMDLKHNFSQPAKMAGRKWLAAFLKNNSLNAKWKSQIQSFNPERSQKLNRSIVSDHFEKVQACWEELDIVNQPQNICNMN